MLAEETRQIDNIFICTKHYFKFRALLLCLVLGVTKNILTGRAEAKSRSVIQKITTIMRPKLRTFTGRNKHYRLHCNQHQLERRKKNDRHHIVMNDNK